ncbi:beta-propeller domain-containing protein [Nocardioides sp.]|uniref:beta-propeller domain-containing protein n=1 Tax=Nocardioides sp. TaxID=35761 RepID=UPI00260942FA|nr:beta-propeller domain-containing protein [Nocardioides sp.]
MTKLEDLWDDFPVRRPSTADLVRQARLARAARRRRRILRPVSFAGVAAALATAFVLGTSTSPVPLGAGGSGGAGSAGPGSDASPVSFVSGLKAPSSCESLLASYKTRAMAAVTAWGWSYGGWVDAELTGLFARRSAAFSIPSPAGGVGDVGLADLAATSTAKNVAGSATGTNVQEAGIDEPDIAKSDGTRLVRLHRRTLDVFDLTGAEPARTGTLQLAGIRAPEMLLSGSTLIVVGTDTVTPKGRPYRTGTRMIVVSLADPAAPTVTQTTTFSAASVTVRQNGSAVRLVLASDLPDLPFVHPTKKRTRAQALASNKTLLRNTTLDDWLPTYDDGHGSRRLLNCDAVALPDAEMSPGTVSIVGLDAAAPTTLSTVGIATASRLVYTSGDHLYLANQGWSVSPMVDCKTCSAIASSNQTYLYAFALDGITARHIASGSVTGRLRDRWSMDAVGDTVRLAVATAPTSASARVPFRGMTGESTEIDVLKIDGTTLTRIGQLGGIGPGESLQSVRWFDDLAFVVTYRQTDPLFAIDLSDPSRPRAVSHLKALGYSTYLHPVGEGKLLGIGVSGILGRAKATLFDVSDPAAMTKDGVVRFDRGTYAAVGNDSRAFTWLPDTKVALTPLYARRNTVVLAVLYTASGHLTSATVPVRAATKYLDAGQVRTFQTTSGRIVLVTPTSVSFVTLPTDPADLMNHAAPSGE